jgi:2,4-didehydro-3-deoxy-L-rhamnonate hydrolase
MKFIRYGARGHERPAAILEDGTCLDISPVIDDLGLGNLSELGRVTERVGDAEGLTTVDLTGERLGSPIGRPHKIVAVGLNYADHAAEAGMDIPPEPILFMKATSSMSGPNDDVVRPRGSVKLDWEVELGLVIGSTARNLDDEVQAEEAIAGYVLVNDVSERAFQLERQGQWVKGKSADTFTPVGPWLVSTDEVTDPMDLTMRLSVNGDVKQLGSTSTMIFSPFFCVRYISQFMTLEPGDLILTGTPPGVGLSTGEYLQPGDVMELEIEGLGVQRQLVVEEER